MYGKIMIAWKPYRPRPSPQPRVESVDFRCLELPNSLLLLLDASEFDRDIPQPRPSNVEFVPFAIDTSAPPSLPILATYPLPPNAFRYLQLNLSRFRNENNMQMVMWQNNAQTGAVPENEIEEIDDHGFYIMDFVVRSDAIDDQTGAAPENEIDDHGFNIMDFAVRADAIDDQSGQIVDIELLAISVSAMAFFSGVLSFLGISPLDLVSLIARMFVGDVFIDVSINLNFIGRVLPLWLRIPVLVISVFSAVSDDLYSMITREVIKVAWFHFWNFIRNYFQSRARKLVHRILGRPSPSLPVVIFGYIQSFRHQVDVYASWIFSFLPKSTRFGILCYIIRYLITIWIVFLLISLGLQIMQL